MSQSNECSPSIRALTVDIYNLYYTCYGSTHIHVKAVSSAFYCTYTGMPPDLPYGDLKRGDGLIENTSETISTSIFKCCTRKAENRRYDCLSLHLLISQNCQNYLV